MKAVLFDIDGTLILTGGAGRRAFVETFVEDFGIPEISNIVSFAGRSDRAIAHDLMLAHGVDPDAANWQRFCAGYLRRLPIALQLAKGYVLPGVPALLDQLSELPVEVGLLTGNIRAGARCKLSHYDLWRRFPFGGFGDDYLDRTEIAAAALAEARQRASNDGAATHDMVVVIGDTPHDIRCARSIGARAVAVRTGPASAAALAEEKPDLLLETLEDTSVLHDWFSS